MASLFGKAKTPKVEPPMRMPDPEAPELREARRRKTLEMQRRGGRESTILTDELMGSRGALGA